MSIPLLACCLSFQCLVSVLAALVASSLAFPYPYPVAVPVPAAFPDDPYHQPVIHKPVVHGYGKPEVGRVKIQVSETKFLLLLHSAST